MVCWNTTSNTGDHSNTTKILSTNLSENLSIDTSLPSPLVASFQSPVSGSGGGNGGRGNGILTMSIANGVQHQNGGITNTTSVASFVAPPPGTGHRGVGGNAGSNGEVRQSPMLHMQQTTNYITNTSGKVGSHVLLTILSTFVLYALHNTLWLSLVTSTLPWSQYKF